MNEGREGAGHGEHDPGLPIDLLNAIVDKLEQVVEVERRSCMCGDID